MIATIAGEWFSNDWRNDRYWNATIAEIELKSISAIFVATITAIAAITEECFQIIATIAGLFFFLTMAAIVAIIWKPPLRDWNGLSS